jgi:hypothetical protein
MEENDIEAFLRAIGVTDEEEARDLGKKIGAFSGGFYDGLKGDKDHIDVPFLPMFAFISAILNKGLKL